MLACGVCGCGFAQQVCFSGVMSWLRDAHSDGLALYHSYCSLTGPPKGLLHLMSCFLVQQVAVYTSPKDPDAS